MSSGGSKSQVVGYRYLMRLHMGLCYAPVDAVTSIDVDDRNAWAGNVTTSGTAWIGAWHIFGGDEREGGLQGDLHIQMGEPSQMPSHLLPNPHGTLPGTLPAYRGILSLVYNGRVSANNPYIKSWATTVRRVLKGWAGDAPWYPDKAPIGDDMNPAHIIYQCLTDPQWGMGYPSLSISNASFVAAADKLYSEGFGLSMMWTQQATIQQFIQTVLDHIGGALRVNPKTGLFELQLIRADYNPEALPIFNESNIVQIQSIQRAGWGETINEITLTYTDPDSRNETAITIQDLANIQAQGGVVSQKINLSGICSHEIAQRVAQRELQTRSTPLAKVKFSVNRQAWALLQGDVIRLQWSKLGLDVVLRVVNMSSGTLENNIIQIDAVEDVFGLPASSYASNQAGGWEDPLRDPAPAPRQAVKEATYYDLVRNLSQNDLSAIAPEDGYLLAFAQAPHSLSIAYQLQTRTSAAEFATVDTAPHCAAAVLAEALPIAESSTVTAMIVGDLSVFELGRYGVIGDEYVRIDAIDGDTLTLGRGVLDTVPQAHSAGAAILLCDGVGAFDVEAYPLGAVVDARIITRTSSATLDPDLAPIDTLEIVARHSRPYPPARFRLNGAYRPDTVERAVVVSWVHRNRLQQDAFLLSQNEAGVTPEPDVTYTIRIYDQTGALCRSVTDLTDTSYTYPISDELADCGGMQTHLTLELLAVRDGIESYQRHSHTFERNYGGYGFDFGSNWGGA